MPHWAVRVLIGTWLTSLSAVVYAASLAEVVRSFDFESFGMALVIAAFGGGARTILTLATEYPIVLAAIREAIRDLVVAVIGGGAVYVILMVVSAALPDNGVTSIGWVQVGTIALAGWSKGKWRTVIGDFISDYITRQRTKIRGSEPPGPPSIPAPLADK